MKRVLPLLLLVCFAAPAYADPPAPPPVILPDLPTPPPPPTPKCQTLPESSLYVIRSSVPCTVLASPEGLVKITSEAGPIKVRSVLVGGTGKVECRTFTDKYLYFVEPLATGRAELLIIPTGDNAVIRRCLDVVAGPAPAPPTPPDPPTPADPLTAALQAAYAADTDAAKASHLKTLVGLWEAAKGQVMAPEVTTSAQMLAALHSTADGLIGKDSLPKVRRAVADYLNGALGTAPVTFDATSRAKYAAEFQKVATALGGVK